MDIKITWSEDSKGIVFLHYYCSFGVMTTAMDAVLYDTRKEYEDAVEFYKSNYPKEESE